MFGIFAAFLAGLVFGTGLTISRMIDPAKVIGFLDVFGNWDPSLAVVMAAAVPVAATGFALARRRTAPFLAARFSLPAGAEVDRRLVLGAALFGIGWGVVGYCPGPALASLPLGRSETGIFVLAMLAGMAAFELLETRAQRRSAVGKGLLIGLAIALLPIGAGAQGGGEVSLSQISHIHGIAVDQADPSRLFLATHNGLFLASADGRASRISRSADDFMGFTAHPADSNIFFASGHPAGGGNLGFMISTDRGATWTQLAKGGGGPADFHQMAASKADPSVVYGVFAGLQASQDGGRTWRLVGPAPHGLIALAAGAENPELLYAATQTGLELSRDGGKTWQAAYLLRRPASMVHVAGDGPVYAYVVGTGLIRGSEGGLSWTTLSRLAGDEVVLHFAVSSDDHFYAVTQSNAVIVSDDGGRSWRNYASVAAGVHQP